MEKGGLRVAQDLTRRQAARLRDLRGEGKMGYFVNGKLRVKDQRDTVPRSPIAGSILTVSVLLASGNPRVCLQTQSHNPVMPATTTDQSARTI
ncbi:hypothetical protein ACOMHN_058170 [Nucella lapillus]